MPGSFSSPPTRVKRARISGPHDGLPVHTVSRQLYFRLAVDPITIPGNQYHTIVDISGTLDKKIAAIACYKTQFDHKPAILDRVKAAATMTGSLAGVAAAESFAAAKPFAVDDLMAILNCD